MRATDSEIIDAVYSLSQKCHEAAIAKGWWEEERNDGELIALMHSELSEALEALRTRGVEECPHCPSRLTDHQGLDLNDGHIWICMSCGRDHIGRAPSEVPLMDDKIPAFTGVEAELADAVIRICDMAAARHLRLGPAIIAKMRYNATREYRHGKVF